MEYGKNKADLLKKFHMGQCGNAYEFFGCHKISEGAYIFRVWAPHAKRVFLTFPKAENVNCTEMQRLDDEECFEISAKSKEGTRYQYVVETFEGRKLYKADPYAFCADSAKQNLSVVCALPKPSDYPALFTVQPHNEQPLNIYEVNLLSWKRHADNSFYTYAELEKELVPYVKEAGYTHVEFMPVTEFPYEGSWGYQVTGYFSVTSRLGSPEDFKKLVDAFHANGIKVLIDWVPAHFPKDGWGLYEFDGQPLYECPLWDNMEHSGWGTRKFDFGRGEVDSFLLSSARFFFDIYRIDGVRVDAVASMLYLDYDKPAGEFTPNEYGDNRNLKAIEFIKKFNALIKENYKGAITVAEESTAYPLVTGKICDGGWGIDFKWHLA